VDYAFWQRDRSGPTLTPLAEMQPKAQIARPESNEVISAGKNYQIKGAAWSGEAEIRKVEISLDGGKSWRDAGLEGESKKNAWRLWHFEWNAPEPGKHTLLARATDSRGGVQPLERNADYGTYMINHCLPIEVEVMRPA
jgi:hypothetical protein